MVKAVKDIPCVKKTKTQKEMLQEDFQTAISAGLKKFEFIGDGYNYKYLAQYAKDEARRIVYRDMEKRCKEAKAKGIELPRYANLWKADYTRYLNVSKSIDNDGTIHVYCQIQHDGLDAIWKEYVLPMLNKQLIREKAIKEKRKFARKE